ncbi:hypothetical protein [Salinactinospora qingdaonensis]|uniref:Uncharacterized protein n=1 Tax=Salinactinospora qingdaonensis TaxID=702744 RepID=A0ABP7F6K0_9ACTN
MTPPANRRTGSGGRGGGEDVRLPMEQVLRLSLAGPLGWVLEAGVFQEPDSDGDNKCSKNRPPTRGGSVYRRDGGSALEAGANALVVLRRLAVHQELDRDPSVPAQHNEPFLTWAHQHRLGYRDDWAEAVAQRRRHALHRLADRGLHIRRVELRTEWRLVVGLGEAMGGTSSD